MKLTVKNEHGTGVTITDIHITDIQKDISLPVPLNPGDSQTIELPDLASCHVGVTFNENGLSKKVQRPSAVTGDSEVSLVKSHSEEEPHLI